MSAYRLKMSAPFSTKLYQNFDFRSLYDANSLFITIKHILIINKPILYFSQEWLWMTRIWIIMKKRIFEKKTSFFSRAHTTDTHTQHTHSIFSNRCRCDVCSLKNEKMPCGAPTHYYYTLQVWKFHPSLLVSLSSQFWYFLVLVLLQKNFILANTYPPRISFYIVVYPISN